MASSSSSASSSLHRRAKRARVERDLLTLNGCTKTALANVLSKLHSEGLLLDDFGAGSVASIRKEMRGNLKHHSFDATTPYGPVVQTLSLGDACPQWPYVHPLAYVYYLSTIGTDFSQMMFDCITSNASTLSIILFMDELTPGNPLRPDKSRTAQAVYWVFTQWPDHVLSRSACWLQFGVLRSSICSALPAGASGFMRSIMHTFWPSNGPSFGRGALIRHNSQDVAFVAQFGGYLCDEKAHKELFFLKGASGSKPCINCANLLQFVEEEDLGTTLCSLACTDMSKMKRHTNASVYSMVDKLRVEKDKLNKKNFAALEQALGMNYDEAALLFDNHLRSIVRPTDHCLRDWMHTCLSGGVASTEVARVIHTLGEHGVGMQQVASYMQKFQLPSCRGKVDTQWLTKARVMDDHVRLASASDLLSIIPILHLFLIEVVNPMGVMRDHIRCFSLLAEIIHIFALGPSGAMACVNQLKSLIANRNSLFVKLYGEFVKPKMHHLFHIPDGMRFVGKLLACFVTERRHRLVKAAALHTFRHFESTVLLDLVNRQVEELSSNAVFSAARLVSARATTESDISISYTAVLRCGECHKGDVLHLANGRVARALAFFEQNSEVFAHVELLSPTAQPSDFRFGGFLCFVGAQDVTDILIWAQLSATTIKVLVPSR